MGIRNASKDQKYFLVVRNMGRNYCFDCAFQLMIMFAMKSRFMNHKINGVLCADNGRFEQALHRLEERHASRFEHFSRQH